MKFIEGGVCAPKGFKAAGLHVGVKTTNVNKKDLALIVSDNECNAAAVYTKNVVKAAPLNVTKENLKNGKAQAIFANSGNANACAPNGEENAKRMCQSIAKALGINETEIVVASTGVIGQELPITVIEDAAAKLYTQLSYEGSNDAAAAIMTTDLATKELAIEFEIDGKLIKIGGIAKGSGMIHPNMGTMLAFLTTDCAISHELMQKALIGATNISFNRVSVDGDSSTNDMLTLLANGLAKNDEITETNDAYHIFTNALNTLCIEFAKMIAADGEGATHLITCHVQGTKDEADAEKISKSVISSSLVKSAMFGADANWGRVLCAMGYSGVNFDPEDVDVFFESRMGNIAVCKNGRGLLFDEDQAKKILSERNISINITLSIGTAQCTCWGCDLTYDYVRINGDYRS
ncbi:MAG: bifunctional glutamate N-acetyltransferase/amino-acid acetyltransferase ArgJ [Oscillospiraceae bacterium]|nr:bifunctional glutamate N-acetyltransferase/amino-acid acetyltransferase ArgJ [Oscillospiraceae bacterium]